MTENSALQHVSRIAPSTVDPVTKIAVELAIAYVAGNSVSVVELPLLLRRIKEELERPVDWLDVSNPGPSSANLRDVHPSDDIEASQRPAVPVEESITEEFLVCLEDGGRYRTLKRHLAAQYGLTPEEYRRKWQLPADYPMVAPEYAKQRAAVAKRIGLGGNKRIGLGGKTTPKRTLTRTPKRAVRNQPS